MSVEGGKGKRRKLGVGKEGRWGRVREIRELKGEGGKAGRKKGGD